MPPLPPLPARPAVKLSADAVAATALNNSYVPDVNRTHADSLQSDTVAAVRPRTADTADTAADTAVATAEAERSAGDTAVQAAAAPALLREKKPGTAARKTSGRTAASAARKTPLQGSRATAAQQTEGAAACADRTARRLYVLDTNVLLHDPLSLFKFEEHDVYLPMIVLEELDGHKKGMSEVARNARQISRTLDALAQAAENRMDDGLALNATGHLECRGKLYFQTPGLDAQLPALSLPSGKADNQILRITGALMNLHENSVVAEPGGKNADGIPLEQRRSTAKEVVLVSKDINMRIKSRALSIKAEDYRNDKVLDDDDLFNNGMLQLPADFWSQLGDDIESWTQDGYPHYRISGELVQQLHLNQFVYLDSDEDSPLFARVTEVRGDTAVLRTLKDYSHRKNAIWGITARNKEQNFALNILMDSDVDIVTLAGTAGTGKTLMALCAGLTQVLDERRYNEIIMTRATVSVGDDIGYLPGTEEEKMSPWMGALDDNLEFLVKNDGNSGGANEWGRAATNDLIRSKIKIKSLNFMRGRTLLNKFLIIDEAQNLTPKQMKTLITRAGPGTKIVCMGNLAQIDTPYLSEGSSGLTYLVDKFKGWSHSGHITLARGERSRLADYASEVL